MHFLGVSRQKVELHQLPVQEGVRGFRGGPALDVSSEDGARLSELASGAARMIFEMTAERPSPLTPAVFRDDAGRLRVVYKEIALRLKPGRESAARRRILEEDGFRVRSRSRFVENQWVVYHPERRCVGADLVEMANSWAEMDELVFAVPNFVSEYERGAAPLTIHKEQWHLWNRGSQAGQVAGEDVRVREAWKVTRGRPSIVVAVLDDGVDVEHRNLRTRILKRPDPSDPNDRLGRDFFVPATSPDHYDPRPKVFRYPYGSMAGNDIHGTPCAGVIASTGSVGKVRGAAPGCRLLPVKIFHADNIASDARVADAIRYAGTIADVISCSWGGPYSPDVELAVEDVAAGRGGRGVAVFCAAGNDGKQSVDYPAALPGAIAVGASTDRARVAPYSNRGPEISIVAPSSGGVRGIYTTDVSYPNRGFNTGQASLGGADGLHTNDFGGTSSATPLAAGVAALVLSVDPARPRDELKALLEQTADKIGTGYGVDGHSRDYGYGRVNAEAAVKAAQAARSGGSGSRSAARRRPAAVRGRRAARKKK